MRPEPPAGVPLTADHVVPRADCRLPAGRVGSQRRGTALPKDGLGAGRSEMTSRRGPDPTSISQGALGAALRPIRAQWLDEAAIRAHVMNPEHVVGVHSDSGRDDLLVPSFEARMRPGGPLPPVRWGLDVDAFADAIGAGLLYRSTGYTLRVNAG